ncbi:MAG: hypothetical protein PVG12_12920 [Gammaproteobacteria bacterium]|jgi:hypothetical protein
MKYYRCLLIATLVLSTNAHALQPKIGIIEQFDDTRMVAFVSLEDVTNSPEWDPDLVAPPLTVGEAVQAVKNFVTSSTTVEEIEIRHVPKFEKHWHYLIKVSNDEVKPKYKIYVVLMDGKVIPAIIEPEGYK